MTTTYRFPYGWALIETKRTAPGILTHAIVIDYCRPDKSVDVEWCGSFEIAARERARAIVARKPCHVSLHTVEERS
jgi:hypothetical protein